MDQRLLEAVRQGQVEKVRCMLQCGANILNKDQNGSNFLHIAVLSKETACTKLLVEKAPQLALEKNSWGRTPLISACTPIVCLDLIKILVEVRESLEITDDDAKHTALHFVASNFEGFEATKLLLEKGANLNALDRKNMSVVQLAIRNGNQSTVKLLLEYGAILSDSDFMDVDIRHFWSMLQMLLHHKPSGIEAQNQKGYSLLMQIAKFGEVDQVRELLRLGADYNQVSETGTTALMEAVKSGDPEVVRILLNAGANPLVEDWKGKTILSLACKCDYSAEEMLKLVLNIEEFQTPPFHFTNSEVHPQSIVLRKKRSPKLLKLLINSQLKNINLIVNEDFMNMNLLKIFDSHNMPLGPISYLLNNPECGEVTDTVTLELLELLLGAGFSVNTAPASIPPMTILFSWERQDLEDMDHFMKIAHYLVDSGANGSDISLRIVTTKDNWPEVESFRQETLLPDALLMAFLSHNLQAVKLALRYWAAPPLALFLMDKGVLGYEIFSLYDTLSAFGLPLGTPLCQRLSQIMASKCDCSEGARDHECVNINFQRLCSVPPSLKILAKYAVRGAYARLGGNLYHQLQLVCPPGLRSFLLMQDESSETSGDESSTSTPTKVDMKRRRM